MSHPGPRHLRQSAPVTGTTEGLPGQQEVLWAWVSLESHQGLRHPCCGRDSGLTWSWGGGVGNPSSNQDRGQVPMAVPLQPLGGGRGPSLAADGLLP